VRGYPGMHDCTGRFRLPVAVNCSAQLKGRPCDNMLRRLEAEQIRPRLAISICAPAHSALWESALQEYNPFAPDPSCLIDNADRCQLQRYFQYDIVFHCTPP